MTTAKGFTTEGTYTPEKLIAGEFPRVERKITILSGGGVLVPGTVLGRITASGKYLRSLSAAVDGSQTPDAILATDVDATAADATAIAYFTGEFNETALNIGTAHTADSIRVGLRGKSIFLTTNYGA